MKKKYFRNIVLTGGNVKFPGFKERLEQEIRALAPDNMEVTNGFT